MPPILQGPYRLPSKTLFPCLLTMLISNSVEAQNLTDDEQILHHYAAMVKEDLEAYRVYPTTKSQNDWEGIFKRHLARLIHSICFYKPFSDSSRKSRWTFMPTYVTDSEAQTPPSAFIRFC